MKKSTVLTPRFTKNNASNRLAVIAVKKTTLRASAAPAENTPLNVVIGMPYYLPIVANNAQKLVLLAATLLYNPANIEIETSDGEPVWEPGVFFPDPLIDVNFGTNVGELAISAQPNDTESPGIDGDGEVLRIKFRPTALGITKLIWTLDSGLYRPDPDPVVILSKIDSIFMPLDLSASGSNPTVIILNVVPA